MSKSESSIKKYKEEIICEIILLDPNEESLKIKVINTENGYVLFNKICDKLGILEKDYFGLKYIDTHRQQQWLELSKSIFKQIKDKYNKKTSQLFSFRFKHYPKDPNEDLRQDLTKYLLYLQLRRDLFHGKLVGPQNDEFLLASLIMQAEIGNIDVVSDDLLRLSELDILPSINKISEKRIMTIRETFKDLDACDAERLFLNKASTFEMYGVKPISVKDQKGNDIFIGLTDEGISTYSSGKIMHSFLWPNISKLSFSHKLFLFQVIIDKTKHMLGFKCESSKAACAFWKWASDRKCFFTLDRASDAKTIKAGGTFFKKKKSYTFSGRSQLEIANSCQTLAVQSQVPRTYSKLTLIKSHKLKSDSENGDLLSNGLNDHYNLSLQHEEQYSFCDSNDGDVLTNSKSRKVKIKPTAATVGTVLDFMQALKEPLLQRQVEEDTLIDIDTQNTDNYSNQSDNTNEDDNIDFLSEMVDIVEAQQKLFLLKNISEVEPINTDTATNTITNQDISQRCSSVRDNSKMVYVIISLALFGMSIIFGVIRIIYSNVNQSSDNFLNEVKNVPSTYESFRNFFFK